MERELDSLILELKSDKLNSRKKAFTRLDAILNSREAELKKIAEESKYLSFLDFYKNAFSGIKMQASKWAETNTDMVENDPKILCFLNVIKKLVGLANGNQDFNIPIRELAQSVSEIILDKSYSKYFGHCYLQILQKNVLNNTSALSDLKTNHWNDLVRSCFKLLKRNDSTINKRTLAQVLSTVIDYGSKYSHLDAHEMETFLPVLLKKITECDNAKYLIEYLNVSFALCKNLAVKSRFLICEFTEQLRKFIHKVWFKSPADDEKRMLFQLMDLILYCHAPVLGADRKKVIYWKDHKEWDLLLRNFQEIIDGELNSIGISKIRMNAGFEMDPILKKLATRLCYLMNWGEQLTNSGDDEDMEPSSKRQRTADKLQNVLEKVLDKFDDGKINWSWFIILGELLNDHPETLATEDFQQLLKLLESTQNKMEFQTQAIAFIKCCSVMLRKEVDLLASSNDIVRNYCEGLWMNIAENALRSCGSSKNFPKESHILLQVLLKHKKFPSPNFPLDIIKSYYLSNVVQKNDTSLRTLIRIYENFNMDSAENARELTEKLLVFLMEKPKIGDLKSVMNAVKPNVALMAQLLAICCLSKTDVFNLEKEDISESLILSECDSYSNEVDRIIELILLKSHYTLLIELEDRDEKLKQDSQDQLKCIIDESHLEVAVKLIAQQNRVCSEQCDVDELVSCLLVILENTALLVNVMDQLFKYKALNKNSLREDKLVVQKTIAFNMQEIERIFLDIKGRSLSVDLKDTKEILNQLIILYSPKYHPLVIRFLRSLETTGLIDWTLQQINHKFCSYQNFKIGQLEFQKAKAEKLIKLKALEVAISCLYLDTRGQQIVDTLKTIGFKIKDNEELHTILHVVRWIGELELDSKDLIMWSLTALQTVCMQYNRNHYVSGQIIGLFPQIVAMTSKCPELSKNVVELIKSFMIQCSKKIYGPELTVQCLKQLDNFHKSFFHLSDNPTSNVSKIYDAIIQLLYSSNLEIKFEAINCIGALLDTRFASSEFDRLASTKTKKLEFFQKISLSLLVESELAGSEDGKINSRSIRLHLLTTVCCSNYLLRKKMILELAKLAFEEDLDELEGRRLFAKLLTCLACDSSSLMDGNMTSALLHEWLRLNLAVQKIPWYFTEVKSLAEFLDEHKKKIYLAMLKNKLHLYEDCCREYQDDPGDSIKLILPNVIAYLTPFNASCTSIKYRTEAAALNQYLVAKHLQPTAKYLLKKIVKILAILLENVNDREYFRLLTGQDLLVPHEPEHLKMADFEKCLENLKMQSGSKKSDKLLLIFCCERPFDIEHLLTLFKSKVQDSKIKEQKLQNFALYCVLVHQISQDYFKRQLGTGEVDFKAFLCKQVSHFLCHLIELEDISALSLAAIEFLETFLRLVILKNSVVAFKPLLNHVTSTLIRVCKVRRDLQENCLKILKFLTIDGRCLMEEEIARLDSFPNDELFRELRENQLSIKYRSGEFRLIEEIEHFLACESRNIEGLICLRENLAAKKSELREMFVETSKEKKWQLTEEIETNLLFKLIRTLLRHVRTGDAERANEAVRCLGEIGAYDLTRMVFNCEDMQNCSVYNQIESAEVTMIASYGTIINELVLLLVSPETKIFSSAATALRNLMTSNSVRKSLNGKESEQDVRPFMSRITPDFEVFSKPNRPINFLEFLNHQEMAKYSDWIREFGKLTLDYLKNDFLVDVVASAPAFAEKIIPLTFQILTSFNQQAINDEIIKMLNHFFERHDSIQKSMHESIYLNKFAIKMMLDVAESLRICQFENTEFKVSVTINFLMAAKAARFCQGEFTAVMYCELWAQLKLDQENVALSSSMANKDLMETMHEAYSSIGIKEAAHIFVHPMKSRPRYLQMQGDLERILHEMSAQLTQENDVENCQRVLMDAGLFGLASKLPSAIPQYESCWRLGDWSILIEKDLEFDANSKVSDFQREFERCHYTALKCLNNRDELGTETSLMKARRAVVQLLSRSSLECTKNLYKFMALCQQLQQIEDFAKIQFMHENHTKLIEKWSEQNNIPFSDFKCIEPILIQRNCVLKTASIRAGRRTWIPELMQKNSLFVIKQSRISEDCEGIALRTIEEMRKMEKLLPYYEVELTLQDAQISWHRNQRDLAKSLLRFVQKDKKSPDLLQRSEAFRIYGEYAAQSQDEDYDQIYKNYFDPSMRALDMYAKQSGNSELLNTASQRELNYSDPESIKILEYLPIFETIAKYYDRQYTQAFEYMESDAYKKRQENLERNSQVLKALENEIQKIPRNIENKAVLEDKHKTKIILKRNREIDEEELKRLQQKRDSMSLLAMLNYTRNAIIDPSLNLLSIFRIISLWLNNQENQDIKKLLNTRMVCISSHKFIPALPQLTSRLNENNKDTVKVLTQLLERCAREHPHHTIMLILNLVNANVDSKETNPDIETRLKVAKKIISNLKADHKMDDLIEQYQTMALAMIDLANIKEITSIPKNHSLLKIKNYNLVHCPTMDLPVVAGTGIDYSKDIVSVVKWEEKMALVGGINAPKKIFCRCSDGQVRSQLLKGQDDLRQDAVMEQVFSIINEIFRESQEIKKYQLLIRTYKIVPLSRRSGILEWCEDCLPIGVYLVGSGREPGAHEKLRPQDWTVSKCRATMRDLDNFSDKNKKLEKYLEIYENFKPVFHHFFLESFLQPGVWFERRLKYIKSVATTSIVGYILGIGDRHVQNILIDKGSGEVVHIDFGIAFEQGKILPHAELIPFRLTRDIIAPMGISGVNGIFKKLCEKILSILRQNEVIIMTILDVLLYDPLYAWTMTTSKAKRYQPEAFGISCACSEDTEKNSTASRALMRIQNKLRGLDDISSGHSCVEGQIERLILDATNPTILNKLFVGWQPYL